MNASPTTLLTKALTQPVTTQQALVNMGLLSSFSINTTNADSDKPYTLSHKLTCTPSSSSSSSSSMSTTQSFIKTSRRKPAELKFKMESMGAHPEQDDDLDMCPARTRANWPRTALIPWWQPSQPQDKPPYSYATLIAYAILISQDGRLLLSDIYRWISETYPYYLLDKRGWQNSIRHNLSLNKKWFIKVDRRPTQANPGKGCYWTLVPGTEEMFIENITEAGGHNRKHHDVGLTAELSMGHRNNLLARYQQQQQQQQQSGSSMNRHETSQSLSSSANNDKLSTVPPKSCKSSAPLPTPWMGPMYSTFRMTSTTMESVSQETTLKKQKRNSTPLATAPSKRPKLDGTLDPTNEDDDDEYMDTRSDCDSGVDVSNEPLDDKKNTNTGVSGDFTMVAHDDLDLYNVLDHFLDQLPLPETQMDSLKHNEELHLPYDHCQPAHDFDLYAAAAQQQPAQFFPTHPADLDSVLGYPSWNYYSTNGFYCDEANPMFPTLLTSCFDPTSSVTATNAMLINDDAPAYFDTPQQPTLSYSQQDKAPLVIHLNGGCVMDLEEEIADTYLKFEEDDAVLDTLTTMEGNPMVSTNIDYHPQDYAFMSSHYV